MQPRSTTLPGRIGKPNVRHKETEETQMLTSKRVEGRIEYNDGEFAEVQTIGIEGIEKNLLLETIQIHREDTQDTPEEFRHRFQIGVRRSEERRVGKECRSRWS